MRVAELPYRTERTVRLSATAAAGLSAGAMVRITVSTVGVTLRGGTTVMPCSLPEVLELDWLTGLVDRGAYVAEVLAVPGDVGSDGDVLVHVLELDALSWWPDDREAGVDELTVADVNRLRGRNDETPTVVRWLHDQLRVQGDEPVTTLYAGGGELNEEAFRVVGAAVVVDVRLVEGRLVVTRVTERPRAWDGRLVLVRRRLTPVDATRMGRLSPDEVNALRRQATMEGAYLSIWEGYNELEREAARRTASDLGWADYDQVNVNGDGSIELELVRNARSDAFLRRIGNERVGLEASSGVAFEGEQVGDMVIGLAQATPHRTIHMWPDRAGDARLPSRGKVAGAFTLDRVRVERRDSARERIASGLTAPARQLSLLLADEPTDPPTRSRRHEPLSPRVREILGGAPTEAQIQAIDLAVNSQDIVLIQGPPGTGKTRVIAAIQARLSEIGQRERAVDRRVLLTSYQHDAVANLVLAADDGALPAVKLGRTVDDEDQGYLVAWTHRLQQRLDDRYRDSVPHRLVSERQALNDRVSAYRLRPFDVDGTLALLSWLEEHSELVSIETSAEARKLSRDLRQRLAGATSTRSHAEAMTAARRLRTCAEAMQDDGPLTARAVLTNSDLLRLLGARDRQLVEDAAMLQHSRSTDGPSLVDVRQRLLDRLLDARFRRSVVATMPAVEALLHRATSEADRTVAETATPVELVVARFREVVARQPATVRESVQQHTRALAATCQQSVSRPVRDAQTVLFDTVVVDEAARANPLDLMIPLSLAKERAVLVGDHRQLPQLLDESLLAQMSESGAAREPSDVLSRSLFERIFLRLREEQRATGTTRAVTLDQQFRMHPVLGSFVSEQFYAPHGERLTNGTDNSSLTHGLERYGSAVCAWIDVPRESGRDRPTGTSTSRPVEASAVADEVLAILQESPTLSVGVITFYSGQVRAIWEELVLRGVATQDGDSFGLVTSAAWLLHDSGLPRLRIGSVDAFQGREFDVVLLSTTRSRPARRARDFGFLTMPNRLCVVMSRQRRLLVAVGDAEMMSGDAAREATPSLAALHDLTGGAHGVRWSR